MKIVAVCGNGLGSSLIIQMAIEDVVKELGIDAEVSHINLSSCNPQNDYDIVICGQDLAEYVNSGKAYKIALFNILDKKQIKKELETYLQNKK